MTEQPQATHGGKRQGAGRKPRFGSPMRQYTIRLPADVRAALVAKHGTLQAAIEWLIANQKS